MNLFKTVLLSVVTLFGISCSAGNEAKTVKEQLLKAKEEGKTVFMVITDANSSGDKLTQTIADATKDVPDTQIIQMKADDGTNDELVVEYRLVGAPFPLMLIFSDKGVPVGGMLESQATKEVILDAIPTPKHSDIVFALSEGTPVLAIVTDKEFKSNKAAIEMCESAKKAMNGKAEIVIVDAKDAKESKLIKQFNIKNAPADSHIVAISAQGIMQGYSTVPTQAELVAAATKAGHAHTGSCCPR